MCYSVTHLRYSTYILFMKQAADMLIAMRKMNFNILLSAPIEGNNFVMKCIETFALNKYYNWSANHAHSHVIMKWRRGRRRIIINTMSIM